MLFIIHFCESILARRFAVRIDFEVPTKSELDKYKVFTFKSLFVMNKDFLYQHQHLMVQ